MKVEAWIKNLSRYYDGTELILTIDNRYFQGLQKLDERVTLDIKDWEEEKTSQQNKYIWVLIGKIDKKINGFRKDEMSIYKNLLTQAKVRTEVLTVLPETVETFKRAFRVVEILEDGEERKTIRCYPGLSLLTKKQTSDFIEVLIQRCVDEGIEYDLYMEKLTEEK